MHCVLYTVIPMQWYKGRKKIFRFYSNYIYWSSSTWIIKCWNLPCYLIRNIYHFLFSRVETQHYESFVKILGGERNIKTFISTLERFSFGLLSKSFTFCWSVTVIWIVNLPNISSNKILLERIVFIKFLCLSFWKTAL